MTPSWVPPGGWRRALLVGAAVVAIAAVAVFANLALLDATGEDRLGRLNQGDPTLTASTARAATTGPRPVRTATRARTATAAPTTAGTDTDDDDRSGSGGGGDSGDDSSGRGRGRGRGGDDD